MGVSEAVSSPACAGLKVKPRLQNALGAALEQEDVPETFEFLEKPVTVNGRLPMFSALTILGLSLLAAETLVFAKLRAGG